MAIFESVVPTLAAEPGGADHLAVIALPLASAATASVLLLTLRGDKRIRARSPGLLCEYGKRTV
ncbi:MAG: hypothetical protein ACXVHB_31780 [Solirubrobacteraceae bacterium]